MASYATCKFPLVDQWKEFGDKNGPAGFVDSVLSGYAQIVFSDNSVTGLLLLIGSCIGAPVQGFSGLWAATVAAIAAYILQVPRLLIRLGLYTFNAALAGMGVSLFIFSGQGITPGLLITSAMAGLLCVLLTAGFAKFLAPYSIPTLALPYVTTLFILIPSALRLASLQNSTIVIPYLGEVVGAGEGSAWTFYHFFVSVMSGMAEVVWQANIWAGLLFLLGVLVSSRIDALSAIVASVTATFVAIALGLPQDGIMIGLFGYNAVLLMMVLFGRSYRMSVTSFIFSLVLTCFTVILTVWLQIVFAPLGAAVAAFPFVITAFFAIAGREVFVKLKFVPPLNWGVPETIAKIKEGEEAK